MPKPHFRFIYLLFLLISFSSKAQEVNLDSLWTVWNDKTQPDTNRLKAMKRIAWDGKQLSFTSKEIQVAKGDMLYIYSDGFPDQFGGEKGKKYLSGKFKKFLLSISDKPIDEQDTLIKAEFTNWIGDHEQIDDVCVMGVRIT